MVFPRKRCEERRREGKKEERKEEKKEEKKERIFIFSVDRKNQKDVNILIALMKKTRKDKKKN